MTLIDYEEPEQVASAAGVATCLAQEIEWENDCDYITETPAEKWLRMRRWVHKRIKNKPLAIQCDGSGI